MAKICPHNKLNQNSPFIWSVQITDKKYRAQDTLKLNINFWPSTNLLYYEYIYMCVYVRK